MAKGSAGTVGLVPDWPRSCLGSPGWDRAQGGGWGAASSSLQLWHSVPAELAPPPAPGGRLLLWEGREGKVTALGLEPRAGLGCGHCSLYLLSAPSVPTPVLVCPLLGPFAVLVSPPSPSFGSVCPEKGDSPTSGGEERPQYRAREGQIPLAAVAGGQRRSPSGNPCPLPLYPTGGRAPTACTGCSRCLPPSPLSVVAALGAAAVTAKGPPGHFGFGVSQQSGGRNSLTLLRRRCWQRGAGSGACAARSSHSVTAKGTERSPAELSAPPRLVCLPWIPRGEQGEGRTSSSEQLWVNQGGSPGGEASRRWVEGWRGPCTLAGLQSWVLAPACACPSGGGAV